MVLVFAGISLHFIPTIYDIKDNSCSIVSYIVAWNNYDYLSLNI
jgi:hypothetical protein